MNRYGVAVRPASVSHESANDILWVTYRWMSLGLALTGLVAWLVSQSPAALELVVGNRMVFYGLMIAQLGMVFGFSAVAARASTAVTAAMFLAYAGLTGVTFSVLFLVYTSSSIASTFAITGGAFAGLSVFGAVTKRDLSAIGRFAIFAVIGLIIAGVVNMFLASAPLMWITTFAGILIFGALTAYDTQKLKALYAEGDGGNLALRGALTLYLDFINMFLFMLRIFGGRRDLASLPGRGHDRSSDLYRLFVVVSVLVPRERVRARARARRWRCAADATAASVALRRRVELLDVGELIVARPGSSPCPCPCPRSEHGHEHANEHAHDDGATRRRSRDANASGDVRVRASRDPAWLRRARGGARGRSPR